MEEILSSCIPDTLRSAWYTVPFGYHRSPQTPRKELVCRTFVVAKTLDTNQ